MGFQGTLSSVNLGDIFQTLAMNRQTGTLSVRQPEMAHHIWFLNGEIAMCDQPVLDGHPGLLTVLLHKSMLSKQQVDELSNRASSGSQPLRELILASGDVVEQEFEIVCNTLIEEVVCEIFEWSQGDFVFTDGDPVADLANPHVIELGPIKMQSAGVVMEATRRSDEWRRIREVITNDDELYIVDNEGRANLNKIEADQEVLKVLRYLDGRHKLNDIGIAISVSRFDVFAIVSQLILNGIARTRSEQEIVNDALSMRSEGNNAKAKELLESAVERTRVPDVIRPLAEICVELQDIPRAVELYLELIQNEQDDGEIESALADLDKVIGLSPDDPELQIDRAEMLFELGQTDEAAETYLKAANAYLNSRNIEEALTACHRAKDLNHLSPTPHRYLAKAYILDRQTESALVEYKSLWHTLLSSMRPRKAMDQLQKILEEDCKVASLKESVLSYAKGSDAVKTGSALRMLVYLIILGLLGAGGYYGWMVYQEKVVIGTAVETLAELRREYDNNKENANLDSLKQRALDLSSVSGNKQFTTDLDNFLKELNVKYEQKAAETANAIKVDIENRKFVEAKRKLDILHNSYRNSKVHEKEYSVLESQYSIAQSESEIKDDLDKIVLLRKTFKWDEATDGLSKLVARTDLPAAVHDRLKAQLDEWESANKKSSALYERALAIEKEQSLRLARQAFQRAMQGEGEEFSEKSKSKILEIEEKLAININKDIEKAVKLGDNGKILKLIKELTKLSTESSSTKPKQILQTGRLPLNLDIDHQNTTLTVAEDGREKAYKAPKDHVGPWKQVIDYPITGQITIKANRTGFSEFVKQHKVNENDIETLTALNIKLKRGPLWTAQLDGKPVTTPVLAGNLILIGTNKNNLALVNSVGKTSPIDLKADVAVFSADPIVFNQVAYAVIGDRMYAVDLNTRSVIWTYPDDQAVDFPGRFIQSPIVQEHELKAGDLQVFVGTAEGNVVVLEVDSSNKITESPKSPLGWAASAAPLSYSHDNIKGVVYMPAGQRIVAFDISTSTAEDAMEKIYTFDAKGDVLCRPVPAMVEGNKAILVTDSTGSLLAINADPDAQAGVGALASWGLPGGGANFPPIVKDNIAIVGLAGGAVMALDLNKSGAVLWRYPDQNNIGSLNGPPGIGKNGVYVADSTGNLFCIDIKTGKKKWQVDLLSAANTGVLVHEGKVYVGTRAGSIMCFEEGSD